MAKRGRKPQNPALKQALVISRFKQIKELMEQGYSKHISCKKIKVQRDWIYDNFTHLQHRELDEIYFGFSTGEKAMRVIGNGLSRNTIYHVD